MQLTFSCTEATYSCIENTLSSARLGRYLAEAKGDKHLALRLYIWNITLSKALYFPAQICEVAIRNAVHTALRDKHSEDWHQRGSFLCTLPARLKLELNTTLADERGIYGTRMDTNHLVSGLSFGFWVHLLTKNYEDVFWPKYFKVCFPHMPKKETRQGLYDKVDKVRLLRNRIAHHKPIFDRAPNVEYQNLLTLISWVCPETYWLATSLSTVHQTISAKPRG
jgi:hypothetical protein